MGAMKELLLRQQEEDLIDAEYGYTEYLKTYVPYEPAIRYWHSMELLDTLQKEGKALDGFPMFHRMQVLQHIAQMEAYLADRLIVLVTNFDDLLSNLVLNHAPLKNQSYTLQAFVGNPKLVEEKVTGYLKFLVFHELGMAADLYQSALGFDIFPNKDVKERLSQAVIDRHHCVHRDGKDNDGKMVQIDFDYVYMLREALIEFVVHIEDRCQPWISKVPERGFAKDPVEEDIGRRQSARSRAREA